MVSRGPGNKSGGFDVGGEHRHGLGRHEGQHPGTGGDQRHGLGHHEGHAPGPIRGDAVHSRAAGAFPDEDSDERGVWQGSLSGELVSQWGRPVVQTRTSMRGRGPRGYVRSDSVILEDLHDQLTEHPDVDASQIDLAVHEGVVVMNGLVPDRLSRDVAEEIAESIRGVRDVQSSLKIIRPPR